MGIGPSRGRSRRGSTPAAIHIDKAIATDLGQRHQGILGGGIFQGQGDPRTIHLQQRRVAQQHRAHRHVTQGRRHSPGPEGGHLTGEGNAAGLVEIKSGRLLHHLGRRCKGEDQILAIGTHRGPPRRHAIGGQDLELVRGSRTLQAHQLQPQFRH